MLGYTAPLSITERDQGEHKSHTIPTGLDHRNSLYSQQDVARREAKADDRQSRARPHDGVISIPILLAITPLRSLTPHIVYHIIVFSKTTCVSSRLPSSFHWLQAWLLQSPNISAPRSVKTAGVRQPMVIKSSQILTTPSAFMRSWRLYMLLGDGLSRATGWRQCVFYMSSQRRSVRYRSNSGIAALRADAVRHSSLWGRPSLLLRRLAV
jgi:hypothetical protein